MKKKKSNLTEFQREILAKHWEKIKTLDLEKIRARVQEEFPPLKPTALDLIASEALDRKN